MLNKINLKPVYRIVASLLFTLAFSNYFFENNFNAINSVLHIFVFVGAYIIIGKATETKEYNIISFIFALIYSFILQFGHCQYWSMTITNFYYPISSLFTNLLYILGFTAVIAAVLKLLAAKVVYGIDMLDSTKQAKSDTVLFVILWIAMFCAWLPCFLSMYPGVFAYDLPEQTEQIVLNSITRHHPPLHTLIWKVYLELEKNASIPALPAFSIFQMIILSFTLTYLCMYLKKRNISKPVLVATILFFVVNPVTAVISIILTKDIFFAVFFIFSILYIDKIFVWGENNKTNIIALSVFVLMACLFRNNGVYVFVLVALSLLIVSLKNWKFTLTAFIVPVILYMVIDGPIYSALGFLGGTPKEKACIPMQQIASVVSLKEESLTSEEIDEIALFFNYEMIKEWYNPRFADPVKMIVNDEYFNEHQKDFYKLWFSLLKKNPICYVDAFLNQSIPYWFQDANTRDQFSNRKYLEVDVMERYLYPVKRESKLPQLADFYYRVAGFYSIEDKPLIVIIESMATPIWFIFIALYMILARKEYKRILTLLPMAFLWLSFIVGPVCCFRYIVPIYLLYPFLLAVICNKSEGADCIMKGIIEQPVETTNISEEGME